jgi:SpoVK/Ycf46/Vps4 family AAA+-type ATPase
MDALKNQKKIMEDSFEIKQRKFERDIAANLMDIYPESYSTEPHLYRLFLAYFNVIPNCVAYYYGLNRKKVHQWLLETAKEDIVDFHYIKHYRDKSHAFEYAEMYYLLYEDLIIHLSYSSIIFLYRKTDEAKVNALFKGVLRFKSKEEHGINLLTNDSNGLDTTWMAVKKPKLIIEDNYNDDLLPIHQTILKRLSKKNDKGLVLLHGKPGTGKTSYIRYLISKTKKMAIFLPPNMAAAITDPGLMSVLLRYPNSIFVIEDAENIIIDRNRNGSSSVSALLNLADGLLSDCLNIQIICSFNTDLSRVDNALLRKGRLIAKYEFLELETRKAQALSNKLGFSSTIDEPMTLTAIYNQEESDFQPIMRRAIGFY